MGLVRRGSEGYGMRDMGYGMRDAGYGIQDVGYGQEFTGNYGYYGYLFFETLIYTD